MGGGQAGPLWVSSERMATFEDLQFTMGEGPCQDAYVSGRPVHAPRLRCGDLRSLAVVRRCRPAMSGIGGVFAYPLSTQWRQDRRADACTRISEGELSAGQHDDSVAMADVLTETVLSLQDASPDGVLADGLQDAVAYRAEIHQASGMVSIQLTIPVAEALVRIRAHAFANEHTRRRRRSGHCGPSTTSHRRQTRTRRRGVNLCQTNPNRRAIQRQALTATTFVEIVDTLVDDFDVIDVLTV